MAAVDYERFAADGFVRLGHPLSANVVVAMQDRIDQIMLGAADVDYERLMMQLDDDGSGSPGLQTLGFKGPTRRYRKIEGLEQDLVFRSWIQSPLASDICRRVYGPDIAVATFRSMFMNKPAEAGHELVWHQDRWAWLDRDPLVTLYLALDPATKGNGCVRLIAGSHHTVVNPGDDSAFLAPHQYAEHCPREREVALELDEGEVVLVHNWTIHRSGINRTGRSRRAFSVCYMDARTVDYLGRIHPVVFDESGRPADLDRQAWTVAHD